MTSAETLQQAGRIVASLIKAKTPPLFETCRSVYAELGELVAACKRMDTVTPEFAAAMDQAVGKLDVFRVNHHPLKGEVKKMTADEYAAYFQEHVDKALTEPAPVCLHRLHLLHDGIKKALGDIYEGPGNDSSINVTIFVDPFQQASVSRENGGAPVLTSGTAGAAEVKATPGVQLSDVLSTRSSNGLGAAGIMKSVSGNVEKAKVEMLEMDTGWVRDLASPAFLQGRRGLDFGRDGTK